MQSFSELKIIAEYPNYGATSSGRIINIRTGLELKQQTTKGGYKQVTVYATGQKKKVLYVHRIVASLFCSGQTPDTNVVNHLDGDKTNNEHTNLEWTTQEGNVRHAIDTGLNRQSGENGHTAKLTNAEALLIRQLFALGHSYSELAALFGVTTSNISCIVLNKTFKSM